MHFAQFEYALLEIVDNAARCADQQVDAILNRAALLLITGATVCQADFEAGMPAEHFSVFCDLHSQFTGRCEDEYPRLPGLAVGIGGCGQGDNSLKGRNQKCCRFAGAGLCLSRYIPPSQRDWQAHRLYRRAELEARIPDSGMQALMELQGVESELAQMAVGH